VGLFDGKTEGQKSRDNARLSYTCAQYCTIDEFKQYIGGLMTQF
jgi:hypothetical protein